MHRNCNTFESTPHPQYVGKLSSTKTVSDAKNVGDNLLAGFAPSLSCLLGPNRYPAKKCSNYCTIALISHASKVMLKILQARLQQYMNCELPDVQVGFRKGRGTRDQITNIRWTIEKAREFQKNIYFCFIDYAKAFDSVGHNKRNFFFFFIFKNFIYFSDHLTCLLRNLYAGQEATVRTGHGTVTKWERNMSRLYIVTLLV